MTKTNSSTESSPAAKPDKQVSHHYDKWRQRFIAAFASAEKKIGKDNGIFPQEGWMTVHMETVIKGDGQRVKTTSYTFDPTIDEWCVEQSVRIEVKTVMVLDHEMPYMHFQSFSDLLKFKLTFQ